MGKWNKHAKLLYFSQFKQKYDLDVDSFSILHWAVSNWKGKCKANIVEFVLNNGGFQFIDAKTNDGQTVEDVLNSLDEDMGENTEAEKEARAAWIVQRDLILQLLKDFRAGDKVPTANVDLIVTQCLEEEEKKETDTLMEAGTAKETSEANNMSTAIELGNVEKDENNKE